MLAACLCCRKKIPKNEFWGQQGMVKIKNNEDCVVDVDETYLPIDGNSISHGGDSDSKRASNAPHRSLPDIPIAESLNDNVSELYATVVDKVQQKPQGRSPTPSLKKQTSVSQHSSISQADDVSSPYARVKTPPHEYDNVLSAEHPYAQLSTPGPSTSTAQQQPQNLENATVNSTSRRSSHESLLAPLENQQEIPAASAIAGMISASQELPYMTPPIIQQPHFSGDSQDSSKGYTSISVREPLANILAQTGHPVIRPNRKDDSHYATVSDDSDEMYAAIDDPKHNQIDVYTSGSETYAQIQPANAITVSVEINTAQQPQTSRIQTHPEPTRSIVPVKKPPTETPIAPPVDTLKAQMHSRQASSSSNTSSVGNIGSPKPEKRQANSPLPPTPKNLQYLSNSNLTSTSSIPSGRNSVASVIEAQINATTRITSKENLSQDADEEAIVKKDLSPSKDIEGMYAKVMKKNRYSNSPSQNASPILNRKLSTETNSSEQIPQEINITELVLNMAQAPSPGKISVKSDSFIDDNNYETIDKKRRPKSSSYETKDHGYETIPANKLNENRGAGSSNSTAINRKSDGYAQVARKKILTNEIETPCPILTNSFMNPTSEIFRKVDLISSEPGYESLPDQSANTNDPGYETLLKTSDTVNRKKSNSDYDPNYEVLRPAKYENSDDGYAKVFEKCVRIEDDINDGYSRVKENCDTVPGYSRIGEKKPIQNNHDYASIVEEKKLLINNNNNEDTGSDIYASIVNELHPSAAVRAIPDFHNYQTISETKSLSTLTATHNSSGSTLGEKLPTPSSTGQNSPEAQMRYSSTSNTISSSQQQSSNYGSLTGSESDPNYESVRYLDSENPYERLHTDPNISPDVTTPNISTVIDKTPSPLLENADSKVMTSLGSSENGDVDDYFQV